MEITVGGGVPLPTGVDGYSWPIGHIQIKAGHISNRHFLAHEMFHQFQWAVLEPGGSSRYDSLLNAPYFLHGRGFLESQTEYAANEFTGQDCADFTNCVNRVRQLGFDDAPWGPAYQGMHFFEYAEDVRGSDPVEQLEALADLSPAQLLNSRLVLEAIQRGVGGSAHLDYWGWALQDSGLQRQVIEEVQDHATVLDGRLSAVFRGNHSWLGNGVQFVTLRHHRSVPTVIHNRGDRDLVMQIIPCESLDRSPVISLRAGTRWTENLHTRGCSYSTIILAGALADLSGDDANMDVRFFSQLPPGAP